MIRVIGTRRARGRLVLLAAAIGVAAVVAALTAGSVGAAGVGPQSFPLPNGSNGWYTHSPVTGSFSFYVDGLHTSLYDGAYDERLSSVSCSGTGLTTSFDSGSLPFIPGNPLIPVSVPVSVAGDTGPSGVTIGCSAGYERKTYSDCGVFINPYCNTVSDWLFWGSLTDGRTIKIDTTPPTGVTAHPAASPNANGWYHTPTGVSFSGSDPNSGIASCTSGPPFGPPGGSSIGPPDGAFKGFSGGCQNYAGLTAGTAFTYKYDATPPTLAPSVSPNPVVQNGNATASPNASDNLSGIDTASCDPVDTSTAGPHTVSCTATDLAGNTTSATADYTVLPVPQSTSDCKNGAWQNLFDGNGQPFKTQGDCVSYVATKGKNGGNG